MAAKQSSFIYEEKSVGANTRLDYHFSSNGITVRETVIVEGRFSTEDLSTLKEFLVDGAGFKPRDIGLPDLFSKMPLDWDSEDEIHYLDRVAHTNHEADDSIPSTDQIAVMAENSQLPTTWSTEPERLAH